MSDLIRRSDVIDALMQYTWRDEDDSMIDDADEKRAFIEGWFPDIPAVDAVEVVRCRECVNWEANWEPNGFNPDKPRYYCDENDLFPTGDWFCADGQRREDGDA